MPRLDRTDELFRRISLQDDEKDIIRDTDILDWFQDNAERYDNIRILKTKLENAIFDKLADVFILHPANE